MYGSSWWIPFLDNKRCDWFKTLKYENFEAWKIWQAYKHSSRPLILSQVNIAAVIDSGYKLLLGKHNNPVKKNRNFMKNYKLFEIFWKIWT